ncbi:thiopurine S-methyltransferase [Pseudoxanthomonas sp. z9]|uniref:thiopurine S-methyltransferase n=1 Tax=Pseudoxanthomonas sp. z9 TaxID=2584942 RepID=UPI001142CA8F|nr:thiopurine S-methyltransferase [Pseudoxanthomonas sp. z9]
MQPEFWLERWREGRIGFHREEVMPLLVQYWPALALPAGGRVFVPLAGKSLDMIWLAAQGHPVLGAELSPLAVQQFFEENGLHPQVTDTPAGRLHAVDGIELMLGDVFALDAATLATCEAVYDRAALIALPPELRTRYADEIYGRLPVGCRGLLITLEYPQPEKNGPPFSVDEAEVQRLFANRWDIERLERRDILASEASFRAEGVTALHTAVYRLRKRA